MLHSNNHKKFILLLSMLTLIFVLHSTIKTVQKTVAVPQRQSIQTTGFMPKTVGTQKSIFPQQAQSPSLARQAMPLKQQSAAPGEKSKIPEKIETKDGSWEKYFEPNDSLAFEMFYSISADNSKIGGIWILSGTPNGELFLSVNGQKIWWSRLHQKDEIFEDLISISASNVTKWSIRFTSKFLETNLDPAKNPLKPNLDIVGTIWGISVSRGLCQFTKQRDGSYMWKQVKGQEKALAVFAAKDGTVFTLSIDGAVSQKNDNNTWTNPVDSSNLTEATTTLPVQMADPFATNTTLPLDSSAPMSFQMLAVYNKNNVWAHTNDNALYKLSTDTDGKISWEKTNDGWAPQQKNFLTFFSAGQSGVWGVANNTAFRMNASGEFINAGCWNVQQISSGTKVYCATAEPYSIAIMKNQEGLTAAQTGAAAAGAVAATEGALIAATIASPGIVMLPILIPISLAHTAIAGLLTGILTRPARHEIWVWNAKPGLQEASIPALVKTNSINKSVVPKQKTPPGPTTIIPTKTTSTITPAATTTDEELDTDESDQAIDATEATIPDQPLTEEPLSTDTQDATEATNAFDLEAPQQQSEFPWEEISVEEPIEDIGAMPISDEQATIDVGIEQENPEDVSLQGTDQNAQTSLIE